MGKHFSFIKLTSMLIITMCINNVNAMSNFVYAATCDKQKFMGKGENQSWILEDKYYFESRANNKVVSGMNSIWDGVMSKTTKGLKGIQITNVDDQFLASLKESFLQDAIPDYYNINKVNNIMDRIKGTYELMVNKKNISEITERLSKILIYYLSLSGCYIGQIDEEGNFVEIIKSIDENLNGLPFYTKQVVMEKLNNRIFKDEHGILNSYLKFKNLNDSEKHELQELKELWVNNLN